MIQKCIPGKPVAGGTQQNAVGHGPGAADQLHAAHFLPEVTAASTETMAKTPW